MAATTTDDRARSRRAILVVGALVLVLAGLAVLATGALGGGDDRVALRSAGSPSEGPSADPAPDGDAAPTTTPPTTTTTTPTTTTTSPTTTSAPTTTAAPPAPATTAPAPAPAPAPEVAAPTTGTLALELTPPADGWSKDVWVSGPDGTTVLPSTPVIRPIVIEGLAVGTYEVFVSEQGPPYGPDENGVELGGGSSVVRLLAEVAAGGTTTVTDPSM